MVTMNMSVDIMGFAFHAKRRLLIPGAQDTMSNLLCRSAEAKGFGAKSTVNIASKQVSSA